MRIIKGILDVYGNDIGITYNPRPIKITLVLRLELRIDCQACYLFLVSKCNEVNNIRFSASEF